MWESRWERFLTLRRNVEFFDLPVERGEADFERLGCCLLVELVRPKHMADVLALKFIHSIEPDARVSSPVRIGEVRPATRAGHAVNFHYDQDAGSS